MGARAQTFKSALGNGRKATSAELIIRSEAIKASNEAAKFNIAL